MSIQDRLRGEGPSLEHLARAGFAARGLVYCLVGGLALLAAVGSGGETGGSRNALRSLLEQPFGAVLLGVVGLGLVFFALWRVVGALSDADDHGGDVKGLGVRALHVLSGFVYAGLAASAFGFATGRGGGGGGEDQQARDWTQWALSQPLGQWLVGGFGAAVIVGGVVYAAKAFGGDVLKRLAMPASARDWALWVGRLGYAARGVTFALIGGFFILAAWRADESEVKGLGGALELLQRQPYGAVLLGAVAVGLFAFGAFGFVQARYRRIDAPDMADAKALAAQVTGKM